jgi:hypothetical protein
VPAVSLLSSLAIPVTKRFHWSGSFCEITEQSIISFAIPPDMTHSARQRFSSLSLLSGSVPALLRYSSLHHFVVLTIA